MTSSNITYPETEGNAGNRFTTLSRAGIVLIEALQHTRFLARRQRTRNRLIQMDSDQLFDVGLSRREAIEEGRKPFWK